MYDKSITFCQDHRRKGSKGMKIFRLLRQSLILFLFILGLYGCSDNREFARERIKDITNVDIHSNSTIVYHHKDDVFVNGRRAQYTVFTFEKEPVNWLEENAFKKDRDAQNERYFLDYFGFLTLKIEEIPQEYILDFENEYLWLWSQNVYFFYEPNKLMLTVFIAGS